MLRIRNSQENAHEAQNNTNEKKHQHSDKEMKNWGLVRIGLKQSFGLDRTHSGESNDGEGKHWQAQETTRRWAKLRKTQKRATDDNAGTGTHTEKESNRSRPERPRTVTDRGG